MKKSFLILVMMGSVSIFTGCDKDDDKDKSPLEGSWSLKSDVYSGCDDSSDNSSDSYTCTETDCTTLTFKGDGTFSLSAKESGIEISLSGTYSTIGSTITFTFQGESGSASFSISGTTLTLDYGTESETGCKNVETYSKK